MIVKVVVIILQFVGYPAPHPALLDATRQSAGQADAFYAEQSYGSFTTVSDTYGIYTVTLDAGATRLTIAAAAQQAVMDAGVDLTQYGWSGIVGGRCHCVYVSPATATVGAGYGDSNGVWIALRSDVTYAPPWRTIAHEQGHHLFGLSHAHGPLGDYGDMVDLMGYGYGHFNVYTKEQRGWLPPVEQMTETGYYTLAPYEQGNGTRALKLFGGNKAPWFYYFEYRQPIGFDASLPFVRPENLYNGVVIHRVVGGQTYILDMNQTGVSTDTAPALVVGQTWCYREARFSVSVVSATPEALTLYVRFGNCR